MSIRVPVRHEGRTPVQRPDTFLLQQFRRSPEAVAAAFAALRSTLRSAPEQDRLLERLAADGLEPIATILDPDAIARILDAVGRRSRAPPG
jgi:hypothetical protein